MERDGGDGGGDGTGLRRGRGRSDSGGGGGYVRVRGDGYVGGGRRRGGYSGGGRRFHQQQVQQQRELPDWWRSGPCGDQNVGAPKPGLDSSSSSRSGEGTRRVRYGGGPVDNWGGGSGIRQAAGRGDGGGQVLVRNDPVPNNPDHLVLEVERLKISPENLDKIKLKVPMRRPDNGGTIAIQTSMLRVNHFPVDFNPRGIIMHYNIDVMRELPPKHGRAKKISKSDMCMIREKLFADHPEILPLIMTAYDGEKNIFSAIPLPEETFKVVICKGDDEKSISYIASISLVNTLELRKLKDYLSGHVLSIPRNILQGMDLVVKENPARHAISVGRNFYSTQTAEDLQPGILAIKGFQQSLKPTSQGLSLCMDYTVLAFRKRMPVLDFLHEMNKNFTLNEFGKFRRYVEEVLVGIKVSVTHRRTKQKYIISKLTFRNTRYITFLVEDPDRRNPPKETSLISFFKEKYGVDIVHKDIPCLDLGKGKKINYVPMEFCVLADGQRFPKEHLSWNGAKTLKSLSLAEPKDRARMIQEMVHSEDGPCGGGIIQQFGMNVNMNMTTVVGRVLGPPELKLGNPNGEIVKITLDPEKCQWSLVGRSLVEGKAVECWGILDFTSNIYDKFDVKDFVQKLIAKYNSLGIQMKQPIFYEPSSMKALGNIHLVHDLLEEIDGKFCKSGQGRLQFLLCVMNKRHSGYKYLKWISETKVGMVTQCCLSSYASEGRDQYLTNLSLKINAKLGGSNVELMNRLPHFEGEGHVMFIGADVNHPGSRDTRSPSIAAVVATTNWPAANRYAARVCPQYHCTEKILNFGEICFELVECYFRLNKVRPEKIVIFRDGVSEGQFDMVLNEELLDLRRVFQSLNYFPTITLIVAQKRHQTRLFPESESDGASKGNVFAGTVVDTKITHHLEFDFYLCSHHGTLGTSKPTHYHVLWDENKFTSNELQKLIYEMCFTSAKCTKPVSLVPPVYYADLAAYRGRLYHEVVNEMQSPNSTASEQKFYRLHADLENIMFFI